MKFLSNLWQGSPEVVRRALVEAKSEDYSFRIHVGDATRVLPATQVEPGPDSIRYQFDGSDVLLSYQKFSLQVLPASKVVNIVLRPSTFWVGVALIVPFTVAWALFSFRVQISDWTDISKDAIEGFSVAVFVVSYVTQIGSAFFISAQRRQRETQAVTTSSLLTKLERAADVDEYFSRLIQVNLSNMEQYYRLVRSQTEKSYALTQTVATVGFLLLASGIVLSYTNGLEKPATALTVASGILVEFISAVMFYVYNKTVSQLNAYHDKLVSVQDTMLALKIAQIVKDEKLKDENMTYLTRALTRTLSPSEQVKSQDLSAESGS